MLFALQILQIGHIHDYTAANALFYKIMEESGGRETPIDLKFWDRWQEKYTEIKHTLAKSQKFHRFYTRMKTDQQAIFCLKKRLWKSHQLPREVVKNLQLSKRELPKEEKGKEMLWTVKLLRSGDCKSVFELEDKYHVTQHRHPRYPNLVHLTRYVRLIWDVNVDINLI